MTTKQAAQIYKQLGIEAPADIAVPNAEYVKNTRRKIVDNIGFRSTLEATAYQILQGWQMAGAISNLKLQPVFIIQAKFRRDGKTIRAIKYTPDFSFVSESHPSWAKGERVIIEAKGFRTQPYLMRRKLFLCKYPDLRYEEWTRETLSHLV